MAIVYVFVDTCVLSDIICQYDPSQPHNKLAEGAFLKKDMLKVVNSIVEDIEETTGYIIASTFAFVELINKFNKIFVGTGVTLDRVRALLCEPPSWLIVEEINDRTASCFCDLPSAINGSSVSSDDAIQLATAMQRGDDLIFLTTDHIISQMRIPRIKFIST